MMLPLHKVPNSIKRSSDGKKRERTLTTKWLFRVLSEANWDTMTTEGKHIVHEEVTGLAGRVDVALKSGKRVLACIELKAPNVEIDEFALKQAIKYAASYYYVNEGKLDPVMAVCTNGLDAYVMDPAIENSFLPINYFHIDLRTPEGTKKLISILNIKNIDQQSGELPIIKTKRKLDSRPYASNTTEAFETSIFKMVRDLCDLGYSPKISVEMTIQILLLAAARDNGIIPNTVIRSCEASEDWQALAKHCNKLFGDVFEADLSAKKAKHIWALYNRTSGFHVRLDILPAQYMGTVYEKLIKKFFGNKTSFYTPEDMIDTVLSECRPTLDDSILDPTCGSGAFLSKAIDFAVSKKTSPEKLLKFFSDVVGVDKDPIACKVAKVTLLCTFMRKVGEEYRRSGKPLPEPKIQPDTDFFDWNGPKFDLVLGNPPWESIDELPAARKRQLEDRTVFSVYEAKNDQLCYIVEKALSRHLKQNGRFGFVIKLQALLGNQYVNFVKFLDRKVETVFDYGRDQKFGNYAQSAGIVGALNAKNWKYKRLCPEDIATIKGSGRNFGDLFNATQGAQSSANPVYCAFAEAHPESSSVRKHPTNLGYGGPPGHVIPMGYIWKDEIPREFKAWLKENPAQEQKLLSRADVRRSNRHPLSWRHDNTHELNGPILITELNLTPGRDRFPFFIDEKRRYVPLTGQTCVSSLRENIDELYDLAALMVSDFFVPLCRACNLIPRRAGGVCFNPTTVKSRLMVPQFSSDESGRLRNVLKAAASERRNVTAEEMKEINGIIGKYLKWGKQEDEADSYERRSLGAFLQPEGEEQEAKAEDIRTVIHKIKDEKETRKRSEKIRPATKSQDLRRVLEKARAGKKKTAKGRLRKRSANDS